MEDTLVPMAKDGEAIEVHPSCVKAHAEAGWRVVETPPPAPEPKPPGAKSRKE